MCSVCVYVCMYLLYMLPLDNVKKVASTVLLSEVLKESKQNYIIVF